jgi:hypothetical protein
MEYLAEKQAPWRPSGTGEKGGHSDHLSNDEREKGGQSDHLFSRKGKTDLRLAARYKVVPRTIRRDGQ